MTVKEIREAALQAARELDDEFRKAYDTMLLREILRILNRYINGYVIQEKTMKLSEQLKEARKKLGMRLKDVSSETGASISTVSRYESGSRKIPVSYVRFWIGKGIKIDWEGLDLENK